jgi:hypothetical protein
MDKPAYIPAGYMGEAWSDTYTTRPFGAGFETRRQAFYEQVLRNPAPPRGSKRAIFELARLAVGGQPVESVIHESLSDYIEGRQDCADFVMQAIVRLLYQFNEGSDISFSPELLAHAKAATLGFKYWPDEPGVDSMCSWTENHQILFSTAAYLAGQLYPEEVFSNSGRRGSEMMVVHRPRIERWLEMRFKSGFSEWLSNVYYDEDWAALLNLVDFAEGEERERARMILDLSLFDLALNSIKGIFGSTHGRSYEQNKKWSALEGTSDTAKLLFGTGAFTAYDNMSVGFFAMSDSYQVPQVIYEIAQDGAVFVNRQRMGHRIEDAEKWGLSYDDPESGMVFLSNEAYLHPKNAALTVQMFDAFGWWENAFFTDFKPFRRFLYALQKLKLLPALARLLEKDVCRNMRDEANIYTYRTPDYMLSSAQDHRAGYGGDQQHIWQATLGPDAVCFTTHPANTRRTGPTPNYWTGSGTLPRAAQVENVVIAVYNASRMPGLYVTNKLFCTHAWLPKDQFDEIYERDGWVFARKGDGYLALHSMKPYHWNEQPGEDQHREIIANGDKNIWICEMGRRETDGEFVEFAEAICRALVVYKGLSVRYQSPSQGWLEFGWRGPFKKAGEVIPLDGYPRYDNPYCQAGFWAEAIRIEHQGKTLNLNWKTGERTVSGGRL